MAANITPEPIIEYLASLRQSPHPELDRVAAEGRAEGLPIVDPQTGSLLHLLTRATGATRALEIGTAIGYSSLWIATALPANGILITLERDPGRATRARAHAAAAGVGDRVSVMIGDAARYLHKIAGPFDLIFQDGDKKQYEPMLPRLIELLRPGGVLLTDNVLWSGEVVPGFVAAARHDPSDTAAIVSYSRRLAAEESLYTSFLAVGDGVAVSVKR